MQITPLTPDKSPDTLIYLIGMEPADAQGVGEKVTGDVRLAAVSCGDWNADLSPWPAKRAFKGGEDFAGRADAYLAALLTQIDAFERGMAVRRRGIVGYSLAGLFALYAFAKTDRFTLVGSMSGSLWYDGFMDFLRETVADARGASVYLSLGDKESHTRNPRVACVEEKTAKARALLTQKGARTVFELVKGNHFVDRDERVSRGIDWLVG